MWLVHAGNRVDAPGRTPPRFPPSQLGAVARQLHRLLVDLRPVGVVSAAAAGSDLLLLETAVELRVAVHVVLPLPEAAFEQRSVADQGVDWVERYHRVLGAASTITVDDLSEHDDWYLRGNDVILGRAAELADAEVLVALVVRPAPDREAPSATDDFAAKAIGLGLEVLEIDPQHP